MFILRSTLNHSPLKYRCLIKMRHQIRHIYLILDQIHLCAWICGRNNNNTNTMFSSPARQTLLSRSLETKTVEMRHHVCILDQNSLFVVALELSWSKQEPFACIVVTNEDTRKLLFQKLLSISSFPCHEIDRSGPGRLPTLKLISIQNFGNSQTI